MGLELFCIIVDIWCHSKDLNFCIFPSIRLISFVGVNNVLDVDITKKNCFHLLDIFLALITI
jgi:hypothetical protein